MDWDRRAFFTIASGLALTPARGDAKAEPTVAEPLTIPIWAGDPPGLQEGSPRTAGVGNAAIVSKIGIPQLTVYRPEIADGTAVIMVPGGGYAVQAPIIEGRTPARRLNIDGITVFVLTHRLPGEGWEHHSVVALQDVQRAMRVVRQNAAAYGVDPERIGVLGFSAGGHVAASLATRHAEQTYKPIDPIDALSAKPTFAGLIYPVITMLAPYAYEPSIPLLLSPNASVEARTALSIEQHVGPDTAPCFVVHGLDDKVVPVENSLMIIRALKERGVRCEAHLFEHGEHGFGVGGLRQGGQLWPELFVNWARRTTKPRKA